MKKLLKTKLGINYPSDYCFYEPELYLINKSN